MFIDIDKSKKKAKYYRIKTTNLRTDAEEKGRYNFKEHNSIDKKSSNYEKIDKKTKRRRKVRANGGCLGTMERRRTW